jgi:hypothetical protein
MGLAKICARYEIPRPYRGYWAKLQYGKRCDGFSYEGANMLLTIVAATGQPPWSSSSLANQLQGCRTTLRAIVEDRHSSVGIAG